MTNSIASSKCLPPVLLSSGNYGMSQNRQIDESKEYIFVKLTDSAFRAVEEYQRNENAKRFTQGQCAKIQLHGNSGIIQFPTPPDGSGGGSSSGEVRKFGFAIDDVEGSLECIKQTQNELDVLGSLPVRMRIHANEDIYEKTRTKMAIAEETEKSKCIREIKPNQTDIGRKVKKPTNNNITGNGGNGYHHAAAASTMSNSSSSISSSHGTTTTSSNSNFLASSNSRNKLVSLSNSPPLNGGTAAAVANSRGGVLTSSSSRSPNPTLIGGTTTTGIGGGNNNRYSNSTSNNHHSASSSSNLIYNQSLTTATSLSSALTGGLHAAASSNGYSSAGSTGSPPEGGSGGSKSTKMSGLLGNARGSLKGSTGGSSAQSGGGGSSSKTGGPATKLSDISKRKIRERLIHLLALKPFKKPELYARLQNEGLRERERMLISNILKDISTPRDNTYNLKRQMWNDVNENWPFYTEQEVQQLKRRKPQNLTPPLSSDAGSSTSGQSPTSTHTGSPPPLVGGPGGGVGVSGSGMKRASLERDPYEDGMSAVQAKKQRISHFKKDTPHTSAGAGTVPSSSLNTLGMGINPPNARLTFGGGGGNSYGQRNSTASYSPHGGNGIHSNSAVDAADNHHNTDLSFSVLDNVDDFMSNVESSSYYAAGRKNSNSSSSCSNRNVTAGKRFVGGGGQHQQQERSSSSSNKEQQLKKSSPTPYGGNFVPEKSSSSRGSHHSGDGVSSYQRQSPNYSQQQQHHKTSNSVIFSPKTQAQASPKDDGRTNSSHQQQRYQQQQQLKSSGSSSSKRTPTPPMSQQHQQQQHFQQQQYTVPSVSSHHQHQNNQQQQQQQSLQFQPQQPQQQQHSSPTQQIAAAVSSYAAATTTSSSQSQNYDFSKYTPITTIEQRRHYKTEFESDYDEYRQLLAQIEGVGKRFRSLAERLENARQGCPDYYNIKQQIVSEYERIRNEETLKRDKQRFDYLHEKLAHIKQLVTDYDKTLTSGVAQQQQQQHLQQQQQQQQNVESDASSFYATQPMATAPPQSASVLTRNTRLSPMVGGNNSPVATAHYQQQQHHDAETIQQQQHAEITPPTQYNGHAPHVNANDTDTDESSDSNDDDDSNEDDDSNDDDDNVVDNERY